MLFFCSYLISTFFQIGGSGNTPRAELILKLDLLRKLDPSGLYLLKQKGADIEYLIVQTSEQRRMAERYGKEICWVGFVVGVVPQCLVAN